MLCVIQVFGYEMQFRLGKTEEDLEVVSNTGGEFDLPFGFSGYTEPEDEDEYEEGRGGK